MPSYDEPMIVTRADRAAREPRWFAEFMAALDRGVAAVRKDPGLPMTITRKQPPTNSRTSKGEMEAQVRATLPLLSQTGYIDPDQAAKLLTWMHGEGMIQRQPSLRALTDQYLSGGRLRPPGPGTCFASRAVRTLPQLSQMPRSLTVAAALLVDDQALAGPRGRGSSGRPSAAGRSGPARGRGPSG